MCLARRKCLFNLQFAILNPQFAMDREFRLQIAKQELQIAD
jgi:hypothetical protein